jgi:hypothetical protein
MPTTLVTRVLGKHRRHLHESAYKGVPQSCGTEGHRMNLKLKLGLSSVGTGLLMVIAGTAAAAPLPKEGNYDTTVCWSGTANRIDFSKTHYSQSSEFMGTALSNPPGGLGDRNSFHCVGLNTSLDGKLSGSSVCEVTDPDGDKRFNVFTFQADGKVTRETVAGTGKYDGMVVTTKVENLPPFPTAKPGTFQGCNRQTGTYKLK